MSLPDSVRVKLSSEAAESISITPVVIRDIPIRELIEHMLAITGKDAPRLHELLLRGTLVSGASRFRWAGWDADREAIESLPATFPDPDPQRPDRKSTRLNSSHSQISYAVFCLKKKKKRPRRVYRSCSVSCVTWRLAHSC